MTIIFFTRSRDELPRQGRSVFESLSISDPLALQEQHLSAAIILNHDLEATAAKVIQQRFPTLQLQQSTAGEVLFELANVKGTIIQ